MTTPVPAPRPRARRLRVAVLLLAPLLGLALAEGLLQLLQAAGSLPPLLRMPGARTVYADCETLPELLAAEDYTWQPGDRVGDFVLNARALRTPDYATRKAVGTTRVVVLGDSHSYRSGGVPTPMLWDRRLAADLRARVDTPLEFINLSVPAVGPAFELRMWQLEGARLRPDLLVLAFSVSNDLMEMQGGLADRTELDERARRWLLVRLWRNVGLAWAARDAGRGGAGDDGLGVVIPGAETRYDPDEPAFDVETHERIVWSRMAISDLRRTLLFEESVAGVREVLTSLRDDMRAFGGELVVLFIPAEHQVDDALFERLVAARQREPEQFDRARPQRDLGAVCDELGVPWVDPLAEIRAAAEHARMYKLRETHLTDVGHAILAERLGALLLERGLLGEG